MQRTPYQLSGRIGPLYPVCLFFALLAAGAGGYLHGFATVHNPVFGLGSLVLALLLGYGVGWATALAGWWGRCRNRMIPFVMGGFLATLALYISWATALLISHNGLNTVSPLPVAVLIQQPEYWFVMMLDVAQNGWPSHFHHRPQSAYLWLFWLVEWVAVVLPAGMRAVGCRRVFCESCRVWLPEPRRFYLAAAKEDEVDLEALAEPRWSYLTRLHPAINRALQSHVLLTLFRCPRCRERGAFGVHLGLACNHPKSGVEIDYRPMTRLTTLQAEDLGPMTQLEDQHSPEQTGGKVEPLSWLGDRRLGIHSLFH
ncbi:hypothetical protein [Acanthopleuribacter pedis]|uniref:Uncharacterized protein n=1 Tax=Acanthopleuribacter pedis TaxID=442870 RepID=A0A8J7QJG6_9BACT|nr:hypothetical protein [Acanthopleuribacter pedis]MBO1319330.1 hypothetical protein [Acanthopleuribacter pedis]